MTQVTRTMVFPINASEDERDLTVENLRGSIPAASIV
jgi:hypothetical protein